MLISLYLLVQTTPADGLQRFHDLIQRVKSYSVQIATKSDALKVPGKGTLVVVRPSSFRLSMMWGSADYTYVKSPSGAVEYQKILKTYQEFPQLPGLTVGGSPFSAVQEDSLPMVLFTGDVRQFAPKTSAFTGAKNADGSETYTATWHMRDQYGKIVAIVDKEGKLLHFDYLDVTQQSHIHRIQDFSGYVFNPPIAKETFSLAPPLGFTSFQMPMVEAQVAVGDALKFGKWKSKTGPIDLDSIVRGKLVVVREPDSYPCNALVNFLGKAKLPVQTVVVSLAGSGGTYWSPPPAVAAKLSSIGTPLILLIGKQGKISAMWLGFDADHPNDLVNEIHEALKENP